MKVMNKKIFFILIVLIFLSGILFQVISAKNVCCEKTIHNVWCQNVDESQCSSEFKKTPTSCEATSFCSPGTCVNVQKGICTENTPESVCNEAHGKWVNKPIDEIPECQLGCCLIGNQAAFVTQTKCKRLSSSFGLETTFRKDIKDEVTCIASASPGEEGACVFESGFEKTCKRLTKQECNKFKKQPKSSEILGLFDTKPEAITAVTFYPGKLCSDQELGTNCGPTKKTTCVEGKDEVYFVDSCGNIANIYDSSKVKNVDYWSRIYTKAESCGAGKSNANSKTCGNCDYYAGSTCKAYKRGKDKVKPEIGNYICRDLSCEWQGNTYQHGETWCASINNGKLVVGENSKKSISPGSRDFRLICYNGEVTIEPCAEYRGEICVQSDVNGFKNAACKVNRWQDCIAQKDKRDCLNTDKRDCKWIKSGKEGNDKFDVCVPKYAPGFNFWEQGDAENICSLASQQVIVTYERNYLKTFTSGKNSGWYCNNKKSENHCFASRLTGNNFNDWFKIKQEFCSSLGDCGSKVNYQGIKGYYNPKELWNIKEYKEQENEQ